MANLDNQQIVRSFYEFFNNREFDRILTLFSNDTEFKNMTWDKTHRGTSELRSMVQNWVTAFPDLRHEVQNLIVSGDSIVAEISSIGTHKGPFNTPEGDLSPTNQKISLPTCDVFQIRNGKIQSVHCYLDSGSLLRQLGLKPVQKAA